jgi:hypothetical protein
LRKVVKTSPIEPAPAAGRGCTSLMRGDSGSSPDASSCCGKSVTLHA